MAAVAVYAYTFVLQGISGKYQRHVVSGGLALKVDRIATVMVWHYYNQRLARKPRHTVGKCTDTTVGVGKRICRRGPVVAGIGHLERLVTARDLYYAQLRRGGFA